MNHKPSFLVILSLIFIAGFSLRPGITSIAPALSEIQTHFQVPESLLGLLTAIPVMCMGLLSPLAHWVAQRAGIKMTLLIGFMLVAVGETLRVQTYWFSVLLFTSLLVGIGDALIRPVLSGFIKQHSGRYTPLAIGWYAASMGIGSDHTCWLRSGRF
ncbi:MFS transporter [Vibrio fluvialis]|nr:MFS transporter [Vibrio fluvialis]